MAVYKRLFLCIFIRKGSDIMFCKNCGEPIEECSDARCPTCRAKSEKKSYNRNSKIYIFIFFIIVISIIVYNFIPRNTYSANNSSVTASNLSSSNSTNVDNKASTNLDTKDLGLNTNDEVSFLSSPPWNFKFQVYNLGNGARKYEGLNEQGNFAVVFFDDGSGKLGMVKEAFQDVDQNVVDGEATWMFAVFIQNAFLNLSDNDLDNWISDNFHNVRTKKEISYKENGKLIIFQYTHDPSGNGVIFCEAKGIDFGNSVSNSSASNSSKTVTNNGNGQINNTKTSTLLKYNTYTNKLYGFSIEYPQNFKSSANNLGIVLSTNDSEIIAAGFKNPSHLDSSQYCENSISQVKGQVTYKRIENGWYVLSYIQGNTISYEKLVVGTNYCNGFTITYPREKASEYNSIVQSISNTFKAPNVNSPIN